MGPSDHRPIVLCADPTDLDIRTAVASWIELMARGDYPSAVAAAFADPPPADEFRDSVETFAASRSRVVPASDEVMSNLEIYRDGIPDDCAAWIGFHIPLENGFGIWTTMGVRRVGDRCLLEFEIFHL